MRAHDRIAKMVEYGVLNRLQRKYLACKLIVNYESDPRIKVSHQNMLTVLGRMIDRQRLKLREVGA